MLTTPTITSLNPACPVATGSAQTFTINGANFQSGCTVTLEDITSVKSYPNLTISSMTSTQIVIDPNFGTVQHVWGVQVINPGNAQSTQFDFGLTPSGFPQPDSFGVDYSDARPAPSTLVASGASFAVRYVSSSGNPKNIGLSEAQSLEAAGIDIIIVFETTAEEILSGQSAGTADANTAVSEATAAGAPSNFFCYFACDFDAPSSDQTAIDNYLNGAASVLGVSRVGIYGGITPVSGALTAGAASKGWQTVAWSSGQEDSRVSLFQYATQILSSSCDVDVGMGGNYGQWAPPVPTLVGPGSTTSPGPTESSTSQTFQWDAVDTATSYQLDLKDVTAGTGAVTHTVTGGSTTSDTITGLTAGHTYQWYMYALNGTVTSSVSTTEYLTIQSTVAPPATPTGLGASATGEQTISVTWNTASGATSYTLDRATSSGGPWTQVYSGAAALYSDSGLQAQTTYYYEVAASNTGGSSSFSSPASATTAAAPATPTGLGASATGVQTISVGWNTSSGATGYALDRATSSAGPWTQVYSGASAQYGDSGLQFGTTYYYKVSASNAGGSSAFSSSVSAATYSGVPLGLSSVATTVLATWSGAGSNVNWSNAANWGGTAANGLQSTSVGWSSVSGATSYTLDHATSSGGPWSQAYSGAAAQYTDTNLQPGKTYYYEVRSGTSTGSSVFSAAVSVTTKYNNLAFGGAAGLSNVNDFAAGMPFGSMTFNASAGAFNLSGASINLAGAITNNSTNKQTIALGLTLIGGSQSITAAAGNLEISGNIGQNGGLYGIDILGPAIVTLSGTNSYSGGTLVSSGELVLAGPGALLSGTALTVGSNNAIKALDAVLAEYGRG